MNKEILSLQPDETVSDEPVIDVERLKYAEQHIAKPEYKCSDHPDAPHGFCRNASASEGRYVCECEGWTPPVSDEPVAWGMTDAAGNIVDTITEGDRLGDMTKWSSEYPVPLYRHPTPNASAEMERDAARYRWLRKNKYAPVAPGHEYNHDWQLKFIVRGIWSDLADPRVLDGLIDAAMQGKDE